MLFMFVFFVCILTGQEIPCVVPSGSTVREAAPLLQKFLPRGSLRLITETGKVLSGSDVIPSEGLLQVQVMLGCELIGRLVVRFLARISIPKASDGV